MILVLNAGSSSIKFSVYADDLTAGPHGQVEGIGTAPRLRVSGLADGSRRDSPIDAARFPGHAGAIRVITDWLAAHHAGAHDVAAIGHRVVHGGTEYDRPVLLDDTVMAALEALVPLAPLHQPHALAAIRGAAQAAPGVPQVACFDTAFHHGQARVEQWYALPRALSEAGLRRYGFHGISYAYIASVLPAEIAGGRVVVAHLGNGASMCAMRAGRSVASTMGFTALEGLPMGTRSGAIDPGLVLHLMQQRGMSAAEVEHMLYHDCGLLGVSGISGDMRALLASDRPEAAEAVAMFAYRIGCELGALTAALGGLDALVFTAGIGEHAAPLREAVLRQAGWLGLSVDAAANAGDGPLISLAGRTPSAWVIPTDENLMIARGVKDVLGEAALTG